MLFPDGRLVYQVTVLSIEATSRCDIVQKELATIQLDSLVAPGQVDVRLIYYSSIAFLGFQILKQKFLYSASAAFRVQMVNAVHLENEVHLVHR